VRARSVWRIERRRLSVALLDLDDGSGASEEDAARSSIVSIWRYLGQHGDRANARCIYLQAHPVHHSLHQWCRPREDLRHGALGDPEPRCELVVDCGGGWAGACAAVDGGQDVVNVHGLCNSSLLEWLSRENRAEGGAEGGDEGG
jgi:hypothetical protein